MTDDLQWKHGALTVNGRAGATLRALVKNAEGRPLCRWCGTVVKSPRRAWCSQECVKEYDDATALMTSGGQRSHLLKLEKGVCRSCGLDAEKLQKQMRRAYRLLMHFWEVPWMRRSGLPRWAPADRYSHKRLNAMRAVGELVKRRNGDRKPGKLDMWRSWWEADHITPLVEGGQHTADNLRTLCIWCHRDETAKLATRRAEHRQSEKAKR